MRYKDLAGLRIGKLTVLEPTEQRVRNAVVWRCRCDCGKKPPLKDWVGKRFGMLTVLSYARKENGFHVWHCRCDCGNEVDVRQSNLQNGWTKSCGCQRSPQKNLYYTDGTCLEMLRPDLMYRTNTSGVRGVYYSSKRNKWIAQIMFKQKCYYLGGYDKIEDAARAREEAEDKLFGDFLKWYEEEHSKKSKRHQAG